MGSLNLLYICTECARSHPRSGPLTWYGHHLPPPSLLTIVIELHKITNSSILSSNIARNISQQKSLDMTFHNTILCHVHDRTRPEAPWHKDLCQLELLCHCSDRTRTEAPWHKGLWIIFNISLSWTYQWPFNNRLDSSTCHCHTDYQASNTCSKSRNLSVYPLPLRIITKPPSEYFIPS